MSDYATSPLEQAIIDRNLRVKLKTLTIEEIVERATSYEDAQALMGLSFTSEFINQTMEDADWLIWGIPRSVPDNIIRGED